MRPGQYGHGFIRYGDEENICWGCGYVTPRVKDSIAWMASQEGGMVRVCGRGVWHGKKKVPYRAPRAKA